MPTFAELKALADSPDQVRKILEAVAFWLPMSEELPEALLAADKSFNPLPESAVPLGMVTKDGYKFTTEVSKSEVDALGYANPVRTDIDKAPRAIEFTMMQSGRRFVFGLIHGMDLSQVQALPTGEVVFDEPPIPVMEPGRLVVIGRDGVGSGEQFRGRGYPRVKLDAPPEEAWGTENPIQYPVKLEVLTDETLGFPCRHYIGGKGYDATEAGWVPAAAA